MKKLKTTIVTLAICCLSGLSYPSIAQVDNRETDRSAVRTDANDDDDNGKWGLAGLLGLLGLLGLRKKEPENRYTTTAPSATTRRND